MNGLKHLKLDFRLNGHYSPVALEKVAQLSSLQELCISGKEVQDAILKVSSDWFGDRLTSLQIPECQNVTDEGILALTKKSPCLRHLDISYSEIMDYGLQAIASSCSNLRYLDISHCSNITVDSAQGIIDLLEKLKQLTNLQELFIYSTAVEDTTLKAWSDGFGGQLTSLQIPKCENNTDEGILALTKKSPCLRHLDISYSKITDYGLQAIASSCSNLHYLDISHCSNITVDSAQGIIDLLEKLKQLTNLQELFIYSTAVEDTTLKAWSDGV